MHYSYGSVQRLGKWRYDVVVEALKSMRFKTKRLDSTGTLCHRSVFSDNAGVVARAILEYRNSENWVKELKFERDESSRRLIGIRKVIGKIVQFVNFTLNHISAHYFTPLVNFHRKLSRLMGNFYKRIVD